MEELRVKPDEDTVRRIAQAFEVLGQEDKQTQFLKKKYQRRWKFHSLQGGKNSGKNLTHELLNKGWIYGVKS